MEKDELENRTLWKRFQAGETKAFTTMVNQYSNMLYDYGMRFSMDEELVKDCIQDIFCTLWNRREHLSAVSSIKFYLMKALRQKIIRELPKWQHTTSLNDISTDITSFVIDIEEDTTLPKETHDKIRTCINQLSPRQKELLYLRFYENLKQDKIAELMGLNRQSAYNLQRSALLSLRKLIDYDAITACFSIVYFVINLFRA